MTKRDSTGVWKPLRGGSVAAVALGALLLPGCAGPSVDSSPAEDSDRHTGTPMDSSGPGETGPDGHTGEDSDSPPDTDTDTDTEIDTEDLPYSDLVSDLSCTVQENLLRYDCTASTAESQRLRLSFWEEEPTDAHSSRWSEGTEHSFVLWGLAAETSYRLQAVVEIDGVEHVASPEQGLEVGLPPVGEQLTVTMSGTGGHKMQHVLVNSACRDLNTLLILDELGRVVWYEETTDYGRVTSGLSITEEGTILAILDDEYLLEWELDGTLLREWDHEFLGGYVHHEVLRHNGLIWALSIEPYTGGDGHDYVIDLVRAWDDAGTLITEWSVGEVYQPEAWGWYDVEGYWSDRYPGHYDSFDVNAFAFGDGGDLYLSLKNRSEILRVAGSGASVGDLVWALRADGTGNLALQGASGVSPGFSGQHHITRIEGEDRLMMFDNNGAETSRVLQLALDEKARVATADVELDLDRQCPMVGSAFAIEDHVLAACGPEYTVVELDAAGSEVWTAEMDCGEGAFTYRAVPLSQLHPDPAAD